MSSNILYFTPSMLADAVFFLSFFFLVLASTFCSSQEKPPTATSTVSDVGVRVSLASQAASRNVILAQTAQAALYRQASA